MYDPSNSLFLRLRRLFEDSEVLCAQKCSDELLKSKPFDYFIAQAVVAIRDQLTQSILDAVNGRNVRPAAPETRDVSILHDEDPEFFAAFTEAEKTMVRLEAANRQVSPTELLRDWILEFATNKANS